MIQTVSSTPVMPSRFLFHPRNSNCKFHLFWNTFLVLKHSCWHPLDWQQVEGQSSSPCGHWNKCSSMTFSEIHWTFQLIQDFLEITYYCYVAKSCCISVKAEVSFLILISSVFLVTAVSCRSMRISSSTSRTYQNSKLLLLRRLAWKRSDVDVKPQTPTIWLQHICNNHLVIHLNT